MQPFLRLLPVVLAAASLSACATAPGPQANLNAPTPLDAWGSQVQVNPAPQEIRLASHQNGLSSTQGAALNDLFGRWLNAEAGEIVIQAPSAGPAAAGGWRVAQDSRAFLVARGAANVRIAGYDAGGDPAAPVIVGYIRYVATTPTCGSWDSLTATANNTSYNNFGCAVTANMARQVANPEDMIRPRDTTPASAAQRQIMMEKYRKGEATGSVRDADARAKVSQVVN